MLTYFSIKDSGNLEVYEDNNPDIQDIELPVEDDLYVLIPDNPSDYTTIFYQNNFYTTNSSDFIIETDGDEVTIYADKSREYSLSPQKVINPGVIKSVLRQTIRRCRRGYRLVCGRDENNQRHCWCARN